MDIVGIDISKAKFDAALLLGERVRHAVFSNTEAGFGQLLAWLAKHRPDPAVPLHACVEATGNWGLELADFLHAQGVRVSIINPARIKAYGDSELARNKTDKLDAGLIPSVGLPTATPLEPLPTPPASAARSSRRPGFRPQRTCGSCASWSADVTRLKPPACRNSTGKRQASPRPQSHVPSPPILAGLTGRSRR